MGIKEKWLTTFTVVSLALGIRERPTDSPPTGIHQTVYWLGTTWASGYSLVATAGGEPPKGIDIAVGFSGAGILVVPAAVDEQVRTRLPATGFETVTSIGDVATIRVEKLCSTPFTQVSLTPGTGEGSTYTNTTGVGQTHTRVGTVGTGCLWVTTTLLGHNPTWAGTQENHYTQGDRG